MKKSFLIICSIVLLACQKQSGSDLKELYSLPKKLKEVSGITYFPETQTLYTLEDSGNKNAIYAIDSKGKLAKTITISNATNVDWEDITKDKTGNIYIGDFGNNDNERRDLCIYKVAKNQLNSDVAKTEYKISFSYPEQKEFPPKKKEMFFDVEGFFEQGGYFYLFTKNRSKGFDGTAFIYKIKNAAGTQKAVKIGEFKTCSNYNHCVLTSATISPDGKKVALLSHDKVLLFKGFKGDLYHKGTQTELNLNHFSQKEAIVFKDNNTLLIADEKTNKIGGKLYEFKL
ncbi:SdiA-regulated domain-containing protein [Flavobacterium sp. KACC 22763]|uniref:SdiA-regulated domain-containing protein n=1 Tax=Flavobacterium sp. KACC 22763 TaxID=3025668 RepID=UPI002367406F|nr:SdiA-regulated domain-containing protein [Flavobacterium sp. KACC 22763]WDF62431.1 SdiA-regulated domain-containing protein [Flavobacterium sp. KACC 22763]